MLDPTLQQQYQQTKQIKTTNSQLSTKYKKYLLKTIQSLTSSSNIETILTIKIQLIYNNLTNIKEQFEQKINYNVQLLMVKSLSFTKIIGKSVKRLINSGVINTNNNSNHDTSNSDHGNGNGTKTTTDIFNGVDINNISNSNLIQEKIEKLDQSIRILENSIRLIETNNTVPIIKIKRGLFS